MPEGEAYLQLGNLGSHHDAVEWWPVRARKL